METTSNSEGLIARRSFDMSRTFPSLAVFGEFHSVVLATNTLIYGVNLTGKCKIERMKTSGSESQCVQACVGLHNRRSSTFQKITVCWPPVLCASGDG